MGGEVLRTRRGAHVGSQDLEVEDLATEPLCRPDSACTSVDSQLLLLILASTSGSCPT